MGSGRAVSSSAMRPSLRLAGLVFVVASLLATAWLGLVVGWDSFTGTETGGQRIAASTQLFYGAASLLALAGLALRARWIHAALALWAVTLTVTGAMAPVVWGGAGWAGGAGAGLITALGATLVAWCARVVSRRPAGSA